MTNTDKSNPTAKPDKGHSVPYLRLLPKVEKQKTVPVEEFYVMLYELLFENEIVHSEEDYGYWLFVNQRRVRSFIKKNGFIPRSEGAHLNE